MMKRRELIILLGGAVAFGRKAAEGLIIGDDPFLISQGDQIVLLAAQHGVPTAYFSREFTKAGCLMSYGTSIANGYRQVGNYAGQILNGAKPTDSPVVQPTNFDFVINLKTAKALGLTAPPTR